MEGGRGVKRRIDTSDCRNYFFLAIGKNNKTMYNKYKINKIKYKEIETMKYIYIYDEMKRGGKVRNFIVISRKWEKKKKSEGMKIYLSREKYIYIARKIKNDSGNMKRLKYQSQTWNKLVKGGGMRNNEQAAKCGVQKGERGNQTARERKKKKKKGAARVEEKKKRKREEETPAG